jgi:hypothetical protein
MPNDNKLLNPIIPDYENDEDKEEEPSVNDYGIDGPWCPDTDAEADEIIDTGR